jgi:hypothetical protein
MGNRTELRAGECLSGSHAVTKGGRIKNYLYYYLTIL